MRLLSTEGDEPKLRSFISEKRRPTYAILSHTWMADEDEVQFSDMLQLDQARHKQGWTKMMRAREEAKRRGHEWIWIDTCCIDKSSSAELSEAINSMFRWYRDAAECYVFLADLGLGSRGKGRAEGEDFLERLKRCKWFTRGWTLQEMIAPTPEKVLLYDQVWQTIGTLESLGGVVAGITGLTRELFIRTGSETIWQISGLPPSRKPLSSYSIAQRMSWASDRETTRTEDRAYALFGIFGVNLPIVYGEGGSKAFMRLQDAIMKDHLSDPSIFGWIDSPHPTPWGIGYNYRRPLLAPSPDYFRENRETGLLPDHLRKSFEITSTGVLIELLVFSSAKQLSEVAVLPCPTARNRSQLLGLTLSPLSNRTNEYVVTRACDVDIYETRAPGTLTEKNVKLLYQPEPTATTLGPFTSFNENASRLSDKLLVRFRGKQNYGNALSKIEPSDKWNTNECLFSMNRWDEWWTETEGLYFRASFFIERLDVKLSLTANAYDKNSRYSRPGF